MRLYVLCEGPTEERFVKELLAPYLLNDNIYTKEINLGGVSRYAKIRKVLETLCKGDTSAYVTTMLDYYKLPKDTPGKYTATDAFADAKNIDAAVNADLGGCRNLFINLIVHEFEGLLFSDISAFKGEARASEKDLIELARIKNDPKFPTPEHINDSEMTAPSKRILNLLPGYVKTLNGLTIAKRITIEKIAEECPHFRAWIKKIKALAKEGTQ